MSSVSCVSVYTHHFRHAEHSSHTQHFNNLYLQFLIMDIQKRENLEITTPHKKSGA